MESTMSFQDFAAMRELEHDGKSGWGATTAIWVLVAAVIIFAIVYNWTKNCDEKVLFSTGLANLTGRMDCVQPKVSDLSAQNYGTAQVLAGTVSALNQSDKYINYNLNELNERFLFRNHGHEDGNCGCRGGNRRFDQRSTYEPKSTEVIVSETCQN
ncbi:MAG: hypothetical protein RR513_09380 [Muribaculaceae bacterium]